MSSARYPMGSGRLPFLGSYAGFADREALCVTKWLENWKPSKVEGFLLQTNERKKQTSLIQN
jgi:hypothetical protein